MYISFTEKSKAKIVHYIFCAINKMLCFFNAQVCSTNSKTWFDFESIGLAFFWPFERKNKIKTTVLDYRIESIKVKVVINALNSIHSNSNSTKK